MSELERFVHAGLCVVVGVEDEDAAYADPRDCDNLGIMVCWHPDYMLGDEQVSAAGGAVQHVFETERGRTDFRSMMVIERYLRLALGAVCVLPLYLLDHSGLSMTAGAPSVFDNPHVKRDHHGNGLGWDTTMVGYIYTTAERIRELCGDPQIPSDPFYCPRTWPEDGRSGRNWSGTAHEWIAKQLRDEVDLYDQWLRGEVYWYSIQDDDGETLEGLGGFLGGGIDADGNELSSLEYVMQEAREAAEGERARLDADALAERQERDRAARQDIATVPA